MSKLEFKPRPMPKFKTGAFVFRDNMTVIVTIDPLEDGNSWHMSISHKDRSPTYEELKLARYTFIPDEVVMAQLFPPKKDFVNFDPHCHHLFQIGGTPAP